MVSHFACLLPTIDNRIGSLFLEFHAPVGAVTQKALADFAGTDTLLRPAQVYEAWHSVAFEPAASNS
jgi:hypothetical protein